MVSAQNDEYVSKEQIGKVVTELIINETIPSKYMDEKTIIIVNLSTGFTIGGSMADVRLMGEKLLSKLMLGEEDIHGCGAFSGKDPTRWTRVLLMLRVELRNLLLLPSCRDAWFS
jgi:S-adenosylmethionine synthetase